MPGNASEEVANAGLPIINNARRNRSTTGLSFFSGYQGSKETPLGQQCRLPDSIRMTMSRVTPASAAGECSVQVQDGSEYAWLGDVLYAVLAFRVVQTS